MLRILNAMIMFKNKKSINTRPTFISIYSDLTSSFHRPLVRKELNRKLKSPTSAKAYQINAFSFLLLQRWKDTV